MSWWGKEGKKREEWLRSRLSLEDTLCKHIVCISYSKRRRLCCAKKNILWKWIAITCARASKPRLVIGQCQKAKTIAIEEIRSLQFRQWRGSATTSKAYKQNPSSSQLSEQVAPAWRRRKKKQLRWLRSILKNRDFALLFFTLFLLLISREKHNTSPTNVVVVPLRWFSAPAKKLNPRVKNRRQVGGRRGKSQKNHSSKSSREKHFDSFTWCGACSSSSSQFLSLFYLAGVWRMESVIWVNYSLLSYF